MNRPSSTPEKKVYRVLALDFGHARIGVAVSDGSRLFAQPLETIQGDKNPVKAAKKTFEAIQAICASKGYQFDTVIIGLPLNMNGTESERSREVKIYADALKKMIPDCAIVLFDERMTSLQAERSMKEMSSMKRKDRAKKVDSVSSLILLQSYLDSIALQINGALIKPQF